MKVNPKKSLRKDSLKSSFTIWDCISAVKKEEFGTQDVENLVVKKNNPSLAEFSYDDHFPEIKKKVNQMTIRPEISLDNSSEECLLEIETDMAKKGVCKCTECQCKAELEKLLAYQESQLKGGGRPRKVMVPKLRIVKHQENPTLELVTNLFRPFYPYWHIYDTHDVCKFSEHCGLCSIRSLSLRLNAPKRESFIKPIELMTGDIEENASIFSLCEDVFTSMINSCPAMQGDFGLNIKCSTCNSTVKGITNPIINVNCEQENFEDFTSFIEMKIKENMENHPLCCKNVNYKVDEKQTFLIFKSDHSILLELQEVYKVGDTDYKVLSCISRKLQVGTAVEHEVHFQHEELYLTQQNGEILLNKTPGKVYGVSLVILGKTKAVGDTNCKPYDSARLYETSEKGKRRSLSYETSEKGQNTRVSYKTSEKGKKNESLL